MKQGSIFINIGLVVFAFSLFISTPLEVNAHRSGCHRWHSCPSDTGSYVEGDAGYISQYPTYKNGVTTYPDNPWYRTEYGGIKYTTPTSYSSFSVTNQSYQNKLITLGYLTIGQADGVMGPKTRTAVKSFQKDKRLTSDGIIGGITASFLQP